MPSSNFWLFFFGLAWYVTGIYGQSYDECGLSRGCFGFPELCEMTKDCSLFGSWVQNTEGNFDFEVLASSELINATGDQYVAIGLSFDNTMGDDSVVACALRPAGVTTYSLDMYWNYGDPLKVSTIYEDPKYGISNGQGSMTDGNLFCTFTRDSMTIVNDVLFDLENQPFFILLATGITNDVGELRKHAAKIPSSDAILMPASTRN